MTTTHYERAIMSALDTDDIEIAREVETRMVIRFRTLDSLTRQEFVAAARTAARGDQ